MRAAFIALALAAGALLSGCAAPANDPNCPADARDLPLAALYGDWEARFDGLPGTADVHLDRHPDYAGVRGTIARNDGTSGAGSSKRSVAQLAGDVDDEGALSIDESRDGKAISGNWAGVLTPRSCGREFRGTWRDATNDSTHPFVLSKKAAPQAKP